MYLHLGQESIVRTRDILGIFDLDTASPETIAQASRIPGVSPSDINVLLVLSGR